jgi:hypothetical protein
VKSICDKPVEVNFKRSITKLSGVVDTVFGELPIVAKEIETAAQVRLRVTAVAASMPIPSDEILAPRPNRGSDCEKDGDARRRSMPTLHAIVLKSEGLMDAPYHKASRERMLPRCQLSDVCCAM